MMAITPGTAWCQRRVLCAAQDLRQHLRKGIAMDELWQVAHGGIKYADFMQRQQPSNGRASNGKSSNGKAVAVPEDLVSHCGWQPPLSVRGWQMLRVLVQRCLHASQSAHCLAQGARLHAEGTMSASAAPTATLVQVGVQSYLLWEQAGKPDGADFSGDARRALEAQLQQGKTVEELERALRAPDAQKPPHLQVQPCHARTFKHLLLGYLKGWSSQQGCSMHHIACASPVSCHSAAGPAQAGGAAQAGAAKA